MNFWQAIQSGFRNYANFNGRAVRSEFWFWSLFTFLGALIAETLDAALFATGTPFTAIFAIATFLPDLALSVRRLHDIDRSGWWFLLIFVPLIGVIVLIVWWCRRGSDGDNRFGPDFFRGAPAVSPRPAA